MKYTVKVNRLVSSQPMKYGESVVGTFDTYEEAVAFCKRELDDLANTVHTWQDQNPMAKEYDPDDAFNNGGGDLRISPEPSREDRFSASKYFYDQV